MNVAVCPHMRVVCLVSLPGSSVGGGRRTALSSDALWTEQIPLSAFCNLATNVTLSECVSV
ncbi:hypothetical protein E2C01_019742 [Portunus trituberculatus]|uniref:Uncharacterized protein n=1 Tax=Portunus trituberculatus TaxID=210409 RepID=A0A5B7DYS1_PORTR|nr:hypothetical protein [Portunus trituberculatus]